MANRCYILDEMIEKSARDIYPRMLKLTRLINQLWRQYDARLQR